MPKSAKSRTVIDPVTGVAIAIPSIPAKNEPFFATNGPFSVRNERIPVGNTVKKERRNPVNNEPVKNEPLPVKNEPIPVKNEPIPVKNEPIPVKNEPIPVKNEPIPVKNDPKSSKFPRNNSEIAEKVRARLKKSREKRALKAAQGLKNGGNKKRPATSKKKAPKVGKKTKPVQNARHELGKKLGQRDAFVILQRFFFVFL
jgi:hypothetical protein